jgi:hypothetical protein
MAQRHPSTPAQRLRWILPMLAPQRDYGLVTHLSQAAQASRKTLYRWTAQVLAHLEAGLTPTTATPGLVIDRSRQVLSVLVETHTGERGIQAALAAVTGAAPSLGTISGIIVEAERRALHWMATQAPPGARPLALDEIYGKDRQGAYLHVVDAASYAVWVAAGPLAVDADTWTLVLWEAQARGLRFEATSTDGGAALSAALRVVDPDGQHGRDPWHVLHVGSQVLGRLDRWVTDLEGQTAIVERQVARIAAGQRPRGKNPRTDLGAHAAVVAQARGVADGLRYLLDVLHELTEVVVVSRDGRLLDETARRSEADTLLELLDELATAAPAKPRREIEHAARHIRGALSGLFAFVPGVERVQREAAVVLGPAGVALVAWAWQRRAILGPTNDELVQQFAPAWEQPVRLLLTTWGRALRASSAAENWHSILRPHLAAHRTLSPGLLALLAVRHNHRVFQRGFHAGFSPLQLSGLPDAPTDWLVALGYPPAGPADVPTPLDRAGSELREAA